MDAVDYEHLLTFFQFVGYRVPADLHLHNMSHRMSGYW